MAVYYNENDPHVADWLRELMGSGVIAQGIVDDRSIEDVHHKDLKGFNRCHFFAGVGVWEYALTQSQWPEDVTVWTGSCPCQPYSVAGNHQTTKDDRDLWPIWFKLIKRRKPSIILGEQVASHHVIGRTVQAPEANDATTWLDNVCNDLESKKYTTGAIVFPSCGVGAPHKRERLWFMAHTKRTGPQRRDRAKRSKPKSTQGQIERGSTSDRQTEPSEVNGFWQNADWLKSKDGAFWPVEPGTFPLANGATKSVVQGSNKGKQKVKPNNSTEARVTRIHGYGNAVNSSAAIEFVKAAKKCLGM